ncbi:hypothetical protein AAP_02353 [Ascosphaera apis ARSEF 7405]|uniref:Uncharacterized protein n=1 Tax=Ascosphaera apis ARSEF 7405 TaxID=392613 RepID=A0A168A7B4_9EURO|nr:hypothetical protein AAP_02353 [Ascosphaera apis ARSEF 7405]
MPISIWDERCVSAVSLEVDKIKTREEAGERVKERQRQQQQEVIKEIDDEELDSGSSQASLEKQLTIMVEALSKLEYRRLTPARSWIDFWDTPKARHVLDALAACVASDNGPHTKNYGVSYMVTTRELVILVASDYTVPQEKVEFIDRVIAKGKLLLSKETREERKRKPLCEEDLLDPDCVDFFRYLIQHNFKSFRRQYEVQKYTVEEFHRWKYLVEMPKHVRDTLNDFASAFNATVSAFEEAERNARDPVTIFDDDSLVRMWIMVVWHMGEISDLQWTNLDEQTLMWCPGVVVKNPSDAISRRLRRLTIVFRRAIVLESGLRHRRVRQLLNRPHRVLKVDLSPTLDEVPKRQDKQEWLCYLRSLLGPFRSATSESAMFDLAGELSTPRKRLPVIHAELKLLAFFRCANKWCSRIVLTGKCCLACSVILRYALNQHERGRQNLTSRNGFARDWILPSGIISESTLRTCYSELSKRFRWLTSQVMDATDQFT